MHADAEISTHFIS